MQTLFSSCKWYAMPVLAFGWALRLRNGEGVGEVVWLCVCVYVCVRAHAHLTAKTPQLVTCSLCPGS